MDFEVLEYMPDAVIVAAEDGTIGFINRAGEALFGYERSELVGQPLEILLPFRFRDKHRRARAEYVASPRTRPMGLGLELRGLTKDGHEVEVEIALSPIRLGSRVMTIATVRDVSARKRLEERAREAEKAEEEIKQREEEIRHRDEVLAIASHELRGPVSVVQLQVAAMRSAAADTVQDLNGMRDRMLRVERNAHYLARLVDDLLDLRQLNGEGGRPLELEDADLAALTREAVERVREQVERTGAALTVNATEAVPGRWDPVRIEQIVTNLVSNAAKFGQGKPITVSVENGRDRARIIVMDQGVGIQAEDLERIFERFERASATTGGLGLGLYIARNLVRAHGGRILVHSAPGKGAAFTVELPRATAA